MKLDEVTPVLDVHPPHGETHGPRDFFIHLFTITIGLLIALGLEGAVEWQHHRHLAHDAEASMSSEIKNNASGMPETIDGLHKEQESLKHDVVVLNGIIKTGKPPEHGNMDITFHMHTFDSLSWTTAQTTGALAYMPYSQASEFASLYKAQEELSASEQVAARDAAVSLAPFLNSEPGATDFSSADASAMKKNIETLQGQLMIVDSFMTSLDGHYKKFVAAHPG